ncbi:hypothetical protein PSP6_590072 [Paraburkholderia tropica]|nr:hypothetical protein PSP6_590072 [Paraburkholderia tropica]
MPTEARTDARMEARTKARANAIRRASTEGRRAAGRTLRAYPDGSAAPIRLYWSGFHGFRRRHARRAPLAAPHQAMTEDKKDELESPYDERCTGTQIQAGTSGLHDRRG